MVKSRWCAATVATRRAERVPGDDEDLVGSGIRPVGDERGHGVGVVDPGQHRADPPGAEQDRRGLPAGRQQHAHPVPRTYSQFVGEQAGDLRRPVGQGSRRQFRASAVEAVDGEPGAVEVGAEQRAERPSR